MSTEKLIEKVQKLLNLANNSGASQAEANNAMEKANKLLLMHNLTMADVDTEDEDGITKKDDAVTIGGHSYEGKWEATLMSVIAKYNMCTSLTITTRGKKESTMTVIGEAQNIEIVLYLFTTARNIFRDLAKKNYSEYKATVRQQYPASMYTSSQLEKAGKLDRRNEWVRAYLKGCVNGLFLKLDDQRKSMEKNVASGKFELMIVDNEKKLKDYMASEFTGVTKSKAAKVNAQSKAFHKGVKDGKNTNLNKGIGKDGNSPIQLLN